MKHRTDEQLKEMVDEYAAALADQERVNLKGVQRYLMIAKLDEAMFELSQVNVRFIRVDGQILRMLEYYTAYRLKRRLLTTPMDEVHQYGDRFASSILDILEFCNEARNDFQ